MSITGTFTAKDLVSAAWVHLRPRRSLAIAGSVLVALALFALWLAFFRRNPSDSAWPTWVLLGVLLYLGLAFGVGVPYKCRRSYKQRKDLHRPCSFSADAVGFHFSAENVSGTQPWSDYLKWKEGRAVFLIYMSDGLYQLVPKRFFSSESEVAAFRQILSEKVRRREA